MSYKCPKCGEFAKYNEKSNTFFCEKDGTLAEKDMLPVSLEDMILLSLDQARRLGMDTVTRENMGLTVRMTYLDMKNAGFYVKEIPTDNQINELLEKLEKEGKIGAA